VIVWGEIFGESFLDKTVLISPDARLDFARRLVSTPLGFDCWLAQRMAIFGSPYLIMQTAVLLFLCPSASSFFSSAPGIGPQSVYLRRAQCTKGHSCAAAHERLRMSKSDDTMASKRNEGDKYRFKSFTRGMTPPKNFLYIRDDRWKKFPAVHVLLSNPSTDDEGICEIGNIIYIFFDLITDAEDHAESISADTLQLKLKNGWVGNTILIFEVRILNSHFPSFPCNIINSEHFSE
jgi:hypothetical protein